MSNLKNLGIREDYFDNIDFEKKSNQFTIKICEFIKKHNRNPRKKSLDKNENFLNEKLRGLKSARSDSRKSQIEGKKKRFIFYFSNQVIAESYGLNNLFDKRSK